MICCISNLIVEIKEVGSLAPYLQDYKYDGKRIVDIIIDPEKYDYTLYEASMSKQNLEYMESGRFYYAKLLEFGGFFLHASAVEYEGKAYLFSAPSGTGKTTHTRFWKECFGDKARVFNDDKPALRRVDGVWYAYGTPWCGKDHININMKAPIAGICFLKQGQENSIRRLSSQEAISKIFAQTIRKFKNCDRLDLLLGHMDKLVREIPMFELVNLPVPEAALLSYQTMRQTAEEIGL